jgi:lycopene beta-cyclase
MIYDHVIFGAGLSGLLKAEILQQTLPTNCRVLLIDPNPEDVRHRTFCTWRLKSDLAHPHAELVSHRYSQFRISEFQSKPIIKEFDEFTYERIPGEVFYTSMHEKIKKDSRFEFLQESVESVQESKDQVLIQTSSGKSVKALQVWNSLSVGPADMIQHFFGFEIETESDFFNEKLVDLMDFRLDQKKEVRFVYHLPFGKRRGLVEFTVFSEKLLTPQQYETELRGYLNNIFQLSDFKIHQTEMGAIPMTLDPWPRFSSPLGGNRIKPIGAAAGKIKASTGYSFLRNQTQLSSHWRFRIYDTLLIGIMKSQGQEISKIFPQLFLKNKSHTLFRFLDEKTSFFEELFIFIKLPWKNFLIQLVLNYPFYFVSTFLMMAQFVLSGHSSTALPLLWVLPVIGVVLFGITHGAIDHKLNPELPKLKFYSFYLLGLSSFFALWFFSPWLAVALFIVISSDHFGENEYLRALKISNNQGLVRGLAFVWGLSASLMAPLFHWDEAQKILQTLLRDPNFGQSLPSSQASAMGILLAALSLVSAILLSNFEQKALGRKTPSLGPTIALILTFWCLPLIPGFLTFFCFWHSWQTIQQQKKSLNWSSKKYFLEAAPFSAISSVGLVALVSYFGKLDSLESYLFLLLGALTVSHSLVMKKFYFK